MSRSWSDTTSRAPVKIRMNRRKRSFIYSGIVSLFILTAWLGGYLVDSTVLNTHLENRNLSPSFAHLFGTDWLGRDMFSRTVMGLGISIQVGFIASASSCLIAAILGLTAAMGRTADAIVSWLIDLFLSVPHLVSLILIAFVFGGGMKGIIIGIAFTHWPSLARIIRAEVLQLRSAEYVLISRKLGKSRLWVASRHIFPHLLPQLLVGLLLLFPHAILHEAAVTFIGLGLSPHQPAIGIILSESMRYLSTGMWWLAFFPGICLLLVVRSFDRVGEQLRVLVDPRQSQE